MAYQVSDLFRTTIYNGDSDYDCKLFINGNRIPVEQISKITISSPIIDTTQETGQIFHIGTFISQSITIKFRNLDGIPLTNNPTVYLEIGLKVGEEYEYVPIGHYIIDDLGENYQTKCEITCLDYAVKFKPNIDISQFFGESNEIEAGVLFEKICNYYGVEVGTYPSVNATKKIKFYDSTLSGKTYISMLAENFGGNAKIGRDGKCNIVPLKPESTIEIDAMTSKKIEVGDIYEISRVCFDNGLLKYQAGGNVITVDKLPTEGIDENSYYYLTTNLKYYKYNSETSEWEIATDMKNTLYIRQDNFFITQQEQIDNIYNAVKGFKVQNITCENRADISLDCWDMIKYKTDKGDYYTLNDNEITFTGTSMGKVITNIPTGTKAENTNVIGGNTNQKIKKIQTQLNEAEGNIKIIAQQTTELTQKTSSLEVDVENIKGQISEVADVTVTADGYGTINVENINESEPILIRIYAGAEDIIPLRPKVGLYPRVGLRPHKRELVFTRTNNEIEPYSIEYNIPADLYRLGNYYDEFILDYENQRCYINRNIGVNENGEKYLLEIPTVEEYEYPTLQLLEGDYKISLPAFENAYIYVRLMTANIYTSQFATKVELNSKLEQTSSSINLSVDQKLDNYSTTQEMNSAITVTANEINSEVRKKVNENEIISKINQSAEEIQISADKINIDGKAVNFKTNIQETIGPFTEADRQKAIDYILDKVSLTYEEFQKYDIDGDGEITSRDTLYMQKAILNNGYYTYLGTYQINPYSKSQTISIHNDNNNTYSAILSLINNYINSLTVGSIRTDENDENVSSYIASSIVYISQEDTNNGITMQVGEWFGNKSTSGIEISHGPTNIYIIAQQNQCYIELRKDGGTGDITNISASGITTPTLTQTSLAEQKKNFEKMQDNALDIINSIDIYKYNLKGEEDTDKKHLGFVIGKGYNYSEEVTNNDNTGVDNYSFTSLCCKAIQEQQAIIEQLKKEIEELKEERK